MIKAARLLKTLSRFKRVKVAVAIARLVKIPTCFGFCAVAFLGPFRIPVTYALGFLSLIGIAVEYLHGAFELMDGIEATRKHLEDFRNPALEPLLVRVWAIVVSAIATFVIIVGLASHI